MSGKDLVGKKDNPIATQGDYGWTKKDMELIRETVAKGTNDSEFKLFLYTAKRLDLDPLVGEIWCVKYKNTVAKIFAGRDGFLNIAHRSGRFNGMETKVITKSGKELFTTIDDNDEVVGAICRIWRKDVEHPFVVAVSLKEYYQGKYNPDGSIKIKKYKDYKTGRWIETEMKDTVWDTKTETMIKKTAESQGLRKAFNITGVYSPEENWLNESEEGKKEILEDKYLVEKKTETEEKDTGTNNNEMNDKAVIGVDFGNGKDESKEYVIDTNTGELVEVKGMTDEEKDKEFDAIKDNEAMTRENENITAPSINGNSKPVKGEADDVRFDDLLMMLTWASEELATKTLNPEAIRRNWTKYAGKVEHKEIEKWGDFSLATAKILEQNLVVKHLGERWRIDAITAGATVKCQ